MKGKKKEKELGIYELAKAVRNEIKKIIDDPEIRKKPILYLDSLDLELNVVVSKAAKTGLKFLVVTVGADYEKENISRIKLSFKPLSFLSQKDFEKLKRSGSKVPMLLMTPKQLQLLLVKEENEE